MFICNWAYVHERLGELLLKSSGRTVLASGAAGSASRRDRMTSSFTFSTAPIDPEPQLTNGGSIRREANGVARWRC